MSEEAATKETAGATGEVKQDGASGAGGETKVDTKTEVTSMISADGEAVKADAAKVDGAKKDEAVKADAKTEEKPYALEVPKNFEQHVDKAALEKFTAFAKETGITAEQASKVLAFDLERRAGEVKSQDEAVTSQSATWLDEVKKDKELGGANLAATKASADRAIARFGDDALRKELVALGMENHPPLVRLLAKVGAALTEDSGIVKGASGRSVARRESIYDA